eukprot:CAMPEP_0202399290 /NCGR_PEP_ID=MMETSP1128-20130828/1923_1 /ASSEMBLY_ACC=CAM_ASM_000463 /TAXON_ID=3047 /ORGANISM="Dunaliella tertiolecta, Strain CCMP1320" /LENGTH=126 /DNA_ID=CAMNT_0049002609 /DNA_START=1985 /DNA_END=2366 /DNA_ORIENTATION=-
MMSLTKSPMVTLSPPGLGASSAREGLGRWVHSETPGLRLSFKYSERAELFVSQEGADPRQQGLGVSHVAQEQEANRPDIGRVTVVDGVLDLLGVQLQGEQAVQQQKAVEGPLALPLIHGSTSSTHS